MRVGLEIVWNLLGKNEIFKPVASPEKLDAPISAHEHLGGPQPTVVLRTHRAAISAGRGKGQQIAWGQ